MASKAKFTTMDGYIASFPKEVQGILEEIRQTIRKAAPSGNVAFKKELARYKVAKGSIRFPLDEPIPHDLVTKIAKFRAGETQVKKKAKC